MKIWLFLDVWHHTSLFISYTFFLFLAAPSSSRCLVIGWMVCWSGDLRKVYLYKISRVPVDLPTNLQTNLPTNNLWWNTLCDETKIVAKYKLWRYTTCYETKIVMRKKIVMKRKLWLNTMYDETQKIMNHKGLRKIYWLNTNYD